jgi:hypothetical protein
MIRMYAKARLRKLTDVGGVHGLGLGLAGDAAASEGGVAMAVLSAAGCVRCGESGLSGEG